MRTFAARRLIFGSAFLVLAAAILLVGSALSVLMYPVGHISGYGLLGMCVFLALYNVRKKLTFRWAARLCGFSFTSTSVY